MKIKASQHEQITAYGLRWQFDEGEVKDVPDELALVIAGASDYLSIVEHDDADVEPANLSLEADVIDARTLPHGDLLAEAFDTVADVELASDEEILAVHGIGPVALEEIREALA